MRFKPTGFYVLDLVWAKAPCWPGGALAPVKHVYLKSSVVFCSHASGFVPPSWAAAWPSSASTPAALHLPYGIRGSPGFCRGEDVGSPQWPPQGTCSLPVQNCDQTPVVKGGAPSALSRQDSIGAAQPAGESRDWMHPVLAHTPLSLCTGCSYISPWWFLNCPLHKLFHQTRLVTKPQKTPNPGE